MLPGVFEPTIFSPRSHVVTGPRFIRPIHPKAAVAPQREAIKRLLAAGWWGQEKIDGHRAQIHVPSLDSDAVVVFNRQGQTHRKALPPHVAAEVLRLFRPARGWSALDAEWLKADDRLFVFDYLRREDTLLDDLSYAERYALLPRVYASPMIATLAPLKTVEQCLAVLAEPSPHVEGLVFRSPTTRGFPDTAIVRCRRR